MSARQVRVETRSRHQSDLKRVMHSTARVRKWEKKWVQVGDTSMHIFKWMPIKADLNQQTNSEQIAANKSDTNQQTSLRGILASNDNQVNTHVGTADMKLNEKGPLTESKMLLNNERIQANIDGSQVVDRAKSSQAANVSNNFTSMHQQADNNKRKLDDLDLVSPDSCGSSNCSTDDAPHETNSNNLTTGLERSSKRHRTYNGGSPSTYYDISKSAHLSSDSSSNGRTPSIPESDSIETTTKGQQDLKDDSMMVDDTDRGLDGADNSSKVFETTTTAPVTATTTTTTHEEVCMDSEQDLTDAARLVTEQIVMKVSDCYMGI